MAAETFEHLHEELLELLDSVHREREELQLQLHLAKAELRDEVEALDEKRRHFQHKVVAARTATKSVSEDVGAAMRLVGDELVRGYRRIRADIRAAS